MRRLKNKIKKSLYILMAIVIMGTSTFNNNTIQVNASEVAISLEVLGSLLTTLGWNIGIGASLEDLLTNKPGTWLHEELADGLVDMGEYGIVNVKDADALYNLAQAGKTKMHAYNDGTLKEKRFSHINAVSYKNTGVSATDIIEKSLDSFLELYNGETAKLQADINTFFQQLSNNLEGTKLKTEVMEAIFYCRVIYDTTGICTTAEGVIKNALVPVTSYFTDYTLEEIADMEAFKPEPYKPEEQRLYRKTDGKQVGYRSAKDINYDLWVLTNNGNKQFIGVMGYWWKNDTATQSNWLNCQWLYGEDCTTIDYYYSDGPIYDYRPYESTMTIQEFCYDIMVNKNKEYMIVPDGFSKAREFITICQTATIELRNAFSPLREEKADAKKAINIGSLLKSRVNSLRGTVDVTKEIAKAVSEALEITDENTGSTEQVGAYDSILRKILAAILSVPALITNPLEILLDAIKVSVVAIPVTLELILENAIALVNGYTATREKLDDLIEVIPATIVTGISDVLIDVLPVTVVDALTRPLGDLLEEERIGFGIISGPIAETLTGTKTAVEAIPKVIADSISLVAEKAEKWPGPFNNESNLSGILPLFFNCLWLLILILLQMLKIFLHMLQFIVNIFNINANTVFLNETMVEALEYMKEFKIQPMNISLHSFMFGLIYILMLFSIIKLIRKIATSIDIPSS